MFMFSARFHLKPIYTINSLEIQPAVFRMVRCFGIIIRHLSCFLNKHAGDLSRGPAFRADFNNLYEFIMSIIHRDP